ncbi:Fc.00g057670.m01.CDS01 [Cosmosporella sp. VM-42]
MFQPQPTPFASSCFAPYGLATDLDNYYPVSAGGGGAGSNSGLLYCSQPPLPQQPSSSSAASSPYGPTRSQPQLPPTPSSRGDRSPPQFQQQYGHTTFKMEDQNQHDMAAQQAAAKDYQPVLEGALVGSKTSSDAITQQYAEADRIYVEKTMALPQTYSHYRPIQGDGNCGWRAIGFSYFEKLIESGSQQFVESEVARITTLNHMVARDGGYSYFEDWAEEMLDMVRLIAQHMNNPPVAHMVLHERWNDAAVTGGLIYYLRLLAATYLKNHASEYEPFLAENAGGIGGYCSQIIEIVDREIEHIGIVALVKTLLEPPGFTLEIAYLDRSPGSQVNTYRLPDEHNGQDVAALGPIIYLLYRPDHYDILYRAPPPPPVRVPTAPVMVNRVAGFSHNTEFTNTQSNLGAYTTMDYSMLSMIPGLSGQTIGMAPLAPPPPPPVSSAPEPFSPVQQSPWMPQFPDGLQAPTPQPTPQQPAVVAPPQPPTPPTPLPPTSSSMGSSAPMVATSGLGPQSALAPPIRSGTGYHIRFSPVQLEYEESKNNFPEPTFQVTTNTFKNSVWNRAHYGNPDFHPEEWSPDDEHLDGRVGGKRRVKKESY